MRSDDNTSTRTLRIGADLWKEILKAERQRYHFRFSRSARDLKALRAVKRALRNAERERKGAGRRTALLTLPADPRQLYWFDQYVGRTGLFKRKFAAASRRLRDRIDERPPHSMLALMLQMRWLGASSHERRELELRLYNLGYDKSFLRDPEGCLAMLPRHLELAASNGWLSGHLRALLQRERSKGFLREENA